MPKGGPSNNNVRGETVFRAAALELTSGALASEGTNERQNLETRSLTKEYYGKSLE